MDRECLHAARTRGLPPFSAETESGLVRIQANGMEFRARIYGMHNAGPAVVLLHGFPASSIMWNPLAQAAAAEGYRVLAYDQRGYSPGARPSGSRAYEVRHYLADLSALAEAVGFERYHLVGHDVGAVVAWGAAMACPHAVRSLVALSIPNPAVLRLRLYVKLLALPWLPEAALRSKRWARFRRMLPQNCSPVEADEYRQIFTEPGALTAALNFYRGVNASLTYLHAELVAPIRSPTTFLYGAGEGWVTPEYLEAQRERMHPGTPLEVTRLEPAGTTGHFLVECCPQAVIERVLTHLRSYTL